jgi:hypothetical protein
VLRKKHIFKYQVQSSSGTGYIGTICPCLSYKLGWGISSLSSFYAGGNLLFEEGRNSSGMGEVMITRQ